MFHQLKLVTRTSAVAFFCLMVSLPVAVQAKEPNGADSFTGLISGHDTVAYHQPEAIEKHERAVGERQFSVDYKGATWRFSSKQNADAFAKDPECYTAAYNGYCANALSLGEGLYKTNGKTWEIFDDQLYVFYAPRGRVRWNKGNYLKYKVQADKAWAEFSQDN